MSRFESLARDKMTVIDKILSSQEILKALAHNDSDFLDKKDIDPHTMMYKHIFPYKFVPKTSEEKKTYITMTFGNYRKVGNSYKSGYITFNVFTHQDLFRTDYGTLRTDYITIKLDELFNDFDGLGVGKANFHTMDHLSVNTDYHGSCVVYKTYDFN